MGDNNTSWWMLEGCPLRGPLVDMFNVFMARHGLSLVPTTRGPRVFVPPRVMRVAPADLHVIVPEEEEEEDNNEIELNAAWEEREAAALHRVLFGVAPTPDDDATGESLSSKEDEDQEEESQGEENSADRAFIASEEEDEEEPPPRRHFRRRRHSQITASPPLFIDSSTDDAG